MDRQDKPFDRVHVYQSDKNGELLDTFDQQPFAYAGFDNYLYKRVMYKGYTDHDRPDTPTYILLDHPLHPRAVSAAAG